MALRTAEQALMRAVENFPRWMSIRKRPRTSNGGLYLKAILDEETNIQKELDDYIKDFFLLSYVGREDTLIDYAYVAQIGDVSKDLFESDQISITTDARLFLKERPSYALYQLFRSSSRKQNVFVSRQRIPLFCPFDADAHLERYRRVRDDVWYRTL